MSINMPDNEQTHKDVKRIIAGLLQLDSIDDLNPNDVLEDLHGVGSDSLNLGSLLAQLNTYIEGIREDNNVEPNENDLQNGSEYNGSLTVRETGDLVHSKLA